VSFHVTVVASSLLPTTSQDGLNSEYSSSLPLVPYRDRLFVNAVKRAHYAHCIYEAAQLASRLTYPKVSVIEFGCGGGNGLLDAEMHIAEIAKIFPLNIELYGFDTGTGLPPGEDYRDLLHYFRTGQFQMHVKDTCKTFFADYDPAPIGCVFHDLDFYSSTRDALTLFDADNAHFLPRVLRKRLRIRSRQRFTAKR
jgi:hypothetical protein